MTKNVDQREKDLKRITFLVVSAWLGAISSVKKDLDAKIFQKSGNVETLAGRYDKLQDEFNKQRERKTGAIELFESADAQLEKISQELDGLLKEITDIAKDEGASVKTRDSDDPQAVITEWDNLLKVAQGESKAVKAVFDRWGKLGTNAEKLISDTLAKVKKEVAAGQAGMNSINSQLNALEEEMRKLVGVYGNTATEMNRQDIAAAVRSFLAIFAKA